MAADGTLFLRAHFLLLRRVALCVLAAVSLSLGVHGATASTSATTATTANPAGGVDPDTLPKGSADAVTVVRWLSPGLYQLEVQNTSGIGFIDSFNWVPPANMTITAVTSSEGGQCALVGGDIHCSGKITPPSCTCEPGGDLTVNFTATGLSPTYANGYWTYYGIEGSYLQIETMTPVPYHIPSFSSGQNLDLPVCKKGQTSTKKNPCAPAS
jgi:hypothetical protein